ncbi:HlyD family efflux transporter periplasmic adaptor subunit [Microvirga terrae]|uniref:HlyD family efflux transporter periplasmic adaptor subunit n=1 Tax=Microvirga terrae TaxID=2740529 RepID=A0ABY5RKX9_9HYPH|nr:HlyD family efflux transporter periplasmic adaptor subunit [Microvirga terrae]UVF17883.1 HlyD family efflux transporter periplasmic adaptor subunit [Microvirga terrae]
MTALKDQFFRPQVFASSEHTAASMPAAPVSWRILCTFLALTTGAAAAFVVTAGYARKETATGALISTAGLVRVSARRVGVITALRVRDGDRVAPGQALFTIDAQQGLEGGGTVSAALIASLDAQIRLLKEQIASDPARVANEIVRLEAGIQSVKAQRLAVLAQRDLQAQLVQAASERRQTLAELFQKGSGTKVALQEQEAVHLSSRQSLADLDRQLAAIDRDLEQAQLQREQLPVQQNDRVSQLGLTLADRERERTEIESRGSQVIRAPVAGRVTALQITPGQLVDASRPVLTIVPEGAELKAELFVPSRAIGFVQPGQQVRLMIDAFPYQRFGTLDGSIETVSQAVLAPSEVFGAVTPKEPTYRVAVRLRQQGIQAFGRAVPLQPDMALQADIVLEERSLLAWLLEPILSLRGRM